MKIKFPKIRIVQQIIFGLACGMSFGCQYDGGSNGGPYSEMMRTCVTEKDKDRLVEFMQQCIRDANPKSDEEPEDWIRQCGSSGKEAICPQVPSVRSQPCENCAINHIPCAQIIDPYLKSFCPKVPDD